ncbi:MAG: DUF362 domain-containing protein [Polyangiaceae bacterium]|nr:DUF362 domain-containing protein [Polyangiaceae bacterium]
MSIARCRGYDLGAVTSTLERMLDSIGGIGKNVAGKTVAVKLNLTGDIRGAFGGRPARRTYQVHPHVALGLAALLDRAGARRIRFLDCVYGGGELEPLLAESGWDLSPFRALRAAVDFEDTRNLGKGKRYEMVKVPWGGSLFPAYLLNHSYVDCDYYISLAKLKNHNAAGVTLSIKNNFGVTPQALYSQAEPDEGSTISRQAILHIGTTKPPAGVPQELDPSSPRRATYRVPRHTVDALGIRPIDLAVIDGIESVSGGEGPWLRSLKLVEPGLLIAGRNAVSTDAIATAVMGYNPLATTGTECFPGDNHIAMAMELGLGTADVGQIEVTGLPLDEARFPYGWEPESRFT